MRRGALIGSVSGLLTGPAMLIWLVVYSFVSPGEHLGSTAILGPLMGGVQSTILGALLGAAVGAVVHRVGAGLTSVQSCIAFGAILMGSIGILLAFWDYSANPDRFAAWPTMILGMDVAAPLLAGLLVGLLVAKLGKAS